MTIINVVPCNIEQDNCRGEQIYAAHTYLHGALEDEVGFDCVEFVDLPQEYTIVRPSVDTYGRKVIRYHGDDKFSRINGTFPVNVLGIDKPCTGFFWTKYDTEFVFNGTEYICIKQCGYIVLDEDKECLDWCQVKYEEARASQNKWDVI